MNEAKKPSRLKTYLNSKVPGQLVIQITNQCNAACPQCEMRVSSPFKRSRLSMDTLKKIINAAASQGVKAVSFTGGEPLLYLDQVIELSGYAKALGIPFTRTGTNGFFLRLGDTHNEKQRYRIEETIAQLAASSLRNFWISIDSYVPEVHERIRGLKNVMKGIEFAVPLFHKYGLYPSANLGINRFVGGSYTEDLWPEQFSSAQAYHEEIYHRFSTAFDRFYSFVGNLGFTIVNCCYPMSVPEGHGEGLTAVYGATADSRMIQFTRDEKISVFRALHDAIPRHRSRLRIFSPRISLYALIRQMERSAERSAYACRGGVNFFFIDAENANTFPCGYRGQENFGKYWEVNWNKREPSANCRACEWECFRDPSEMIGPVFDLLTDPFKLVKKFWNDRLYATTWFEDLKYYRACDFFDGRKKPDLNRLKSFKRADSYQGTEDVGDNQDWTDVICRPDPYEELKATGAAFD